jgi:hypothetical protein
MIDILQGIAIALLALGMLFHLLDHRNRDR